MKKQNLYKFNNYSILKNFRNYKYIYYILTTVIFFTFFIFSNNIFAQSSNDTLPLYCNGDILVDNDSGAVLFGKNAYNKVYPASTTKIMTAILAIEKLDSNSSIVASKNSVYSTPIGSSTINIKPGEVFTVEQLLYGLLLISGNDAANVLAESVSGNIDSFVDLMNEKAKDLGCKNTHFENAHGFHDPNHYTTPYDMMLIFRYALKNETFKKIIETKNYVIPKTNKTNEPRYLQNTDRLLFTTSEDPHGAYYEYALGGKTGYTIEARGTFVGISQKDNKTLLVGTFDGSQNISGHEGRFLDAVTLFNYGFNNFDKITIYDKNNTSFNIIDKENKKEYIIKLKDDVEALGKDKNYSSTYNLNVDFNKLKEAINDKSIIVGKMNYNVNGINWSLTNSSDLILKSVKNYTDSRTKKTNLYLVLGISILILILIIYYCIKKIKNDKNCKKNLKYEHNNIDNINFKNLKRQHINRIGHLK